MTITLSMLHRPDIVGVGDNLLLTHAVRLWELFATPCRLDGYAIIVITGGEIVVDINGQRHTLGPDTLAVNFPENTLRVVSHRDAEAYAVLMSPACFDGLGLDLSPLSRIYSDFRSHVVFPLPHGELLSLYHYFALLRFNAAEPTEERRPVLRSLLKAGIFQLFDIIKRTASTRLTTMQATPGRAAALFADFLALLAEHCHEERTVAYYASRLCLTPRHLSSVIKEYSGQSVSGWVTRYVVIEAKRLLANPGNDIQQVARRLNFPTQSAFGKFFKKAEGVNPTDFRRQATNTRQQ